MAEAPQPGSDRRSQLPLLGALAAVVAWGFGPIGVRSITADGPTIVMVRLWVSAPAMWLLTLAAGGRYTKQLLVRSLRPGVLFGVSMTCGFLSFRATSIANATLIPAVQPVIVILVAVRLFGERPSRFQVSCMGVAIGGVATVVLGAGGAGGASWRGDLLALANLGLWAAFFLDSKRVRSESDANPFAFTGCCMLVAAVVITPCMLLLGAHPSQISGGDWGWMAFIVLVPGAFGHVTMMWAHRYVDVTVTSLLTLANPAISAAGAWVAFGQEMRPVQILGSAVVLGAVGGIVWDGRQPVTARRERAQSAEAVAIAEAAELPVAPRVAKAVT